jgi:hypothetical protein
MANLLPEVEIADDLGFSVVLAGMVGTTPSLFPSVATTDIDNFIVHSPSQTPSSVKLYWSLDNLTYWELSVGESFSCDLRKHPTLGNIKQIYLKGSVANVKYQSLINRKDV